MSAPLWSFREVTLRQYNRVLAQDIDLELEEGKIVGVAGESGSGKTTLLRCAAGIEDADAGRLLLEDRAPAEIGWPRYRREVVLVSQQPALLEATVEDNLARPFTYATSQGRFPRDDAVRLLRDLGMTEDRMSQDARSLSVGQQQRVCLIRALLLRPKVLLLDEPTNALDEAAVERAESAVRDAIRNGRCRAALWVSHDREQLDRVADTVVDLTDYAPTGDRNGST